MPTRRHGISSWIAFVFFGVISLSGCLGTIDPKPPIASFGVTPQSGSAVNDTLILNAGASSDPQGRSLTYHWTLTVPAGSMAFLYPDYGPLVSFQADKPGQYAIVLTVTAGSASSTASKTISVAGAVSGISSFGFVSLSAVGTIDESANAITVSVPSGTDRTALVAVFDAKGQSVTVGGATQTSGSTPNDFTSPVQYLVTASDSSTKTYTVTVALSSSDPVIGKWQLSAMNGKAAAVIPMAMNLTISSDNNWIAVGSQPGEPIVTYGTWSAPSPSNYVMTFDYGGPTGAMSMSMTLSGSSLSGSFIDGDGTQTLAFIPGTALIPDPIIGEWHLFSMTPSTQQSMNFAFNSDNSWSMSGVETFSPISASGTWSLESRGNYSIAFVSGGPGVSSMSFILSGGALTGTFTKDQEQTTMILHTGVIELPATIAPLPQIFMTGKGDYAQDFKDQAWRIGPATDDAPWAPYNYMRFAISADGSRYAEYLAGGPQSNTGLLSWHMSGTEQKLDFLDSYYQALYSFTVLKYTANHLHLRMLYGEETREWIFSAGTGNLSGLVVDTHDQTLVDHYSYSKPLSGASIQLGTMDTYTGVFTGISVSAAMTDDRGFFEFSDLGAYSGQSLMAKVSKAGFADTTTFGGMPSTVSTSATIFMSIGL